MKRLFSLIVFLIILGTIVISGYMFFSDMDGPTIALSPDNGSISPSQDARLTLSDDVSGLRSVSISIRKGSQSLLVHEQHFTNTPPKAELSFNLKKSGVRDGQIELEIRAIDGAMAGFGHGNTTVRTYALKVDGAPPKVTVLSPPGASGRKGSAAAVSYTLSEEVQFTGVRVADEFFPAYRQQGNSYFCMLAFPISMTPSQFVPEIIARDLAGNEARTRLLLPAQDRKYREDTLKIDDRFLDSKMPDFADQVPEAQTNLERYVMVNNVVRLSNEKTLREIAKKTAPTILWSGAFMRLPNSASRASFGDHRSYKYGDQVIDNQTHMGQDLASVRHAPVPAANSGIVVFTGDLGIFGNLVVVDHGLGLMSLYSHMSSIGVTEGAKVARGDTLGNTGVTGLAGGDHLHFGILLNGIQVQPLDWLDKNWIKNNVSDRLIQQ